MTFSFWFCFITNEKNEINFKFLRNSALSYLSEVKHCDIAFLQAWCLSGVSVCVCVCLCLCLSACLCLSLSLSLSLSPWVALIWPSRLTGRKKQLSLSMITCIWCFCIRFSVCVSLHVIRDIFVKIKLDLHLHFVSLYNKVSNNQSIIILIWTFL